MLLTFDEVVMLAPRLPCFSYLCHEKQPLDNPYEYNTNTDNAQPDKILTLDITQTDSTHEVSTTSNTSTRQYCICNWTADTKSTKIKWMQFQEHITSASFIGLQKVENAPYLM